MFRSVFAFVFVFMFVCVCVCVCVFLLTRYLSGPNYVKFTKGWAGVGLSEDRFRGNVVVVERMARDVRVSRFLCTCAMYG